MELYHLHRTASSVLLALAFPRSKRIFPLAFCSQGVQDAIKLLNEDTPPCNGHTRCGDPHESMRPSRQRSPWQNSYPATNRTPHISPVQLLLSKKKAWACDQFL